MCLVLSVITSLRPLECAKVPLISNTWDVPMMRTYSLLRTPSRRHSHRTAKVHAFKANGRLPKLSSSVAASASYRRGFIFVIKLPHILILTHTIIPEEATHFMLLLFFRWSAKGSKIQEESPTTSLYRPFPVILTAGVWAFAHRKRSHGWCFVRTTWGAQNHADIIYR